MHYGSYSFDCAPCHIILCDVGRRQTIVSSGTRVRVSGAALTPYNRRKDNSSFRDWACSAFYDALQKSGLEHRDIDALYVASESDFFTLQLNSASVIASDIGLEGASTTRIEGGGASGQLAIHAATRAIQSGHIKHAAVIGVDPSASTLSSDTIKKLYSFSFDAWTDGATDVSATVLYALSFQSFMQRMQVDETQHLANVTIQNRANALHNPNAHLGREHTVDDINESPFIAAPYRRLHCSPLSDGAAAAILSRSDSIPSNRNNAATIIGIGGASDAMHLGARKDPGHFQAKETAMQRACAEALITPDQIGVAEVYDAYAGAQLQAIDALNLSDDLLNDLHTERFAPAGQCPINLSGGLLGQGAPTGATGVGQTASVALILEGDYVPALQPQVIPRYGLADTHGGVCTTSAVTLLEKSVAI